MSVTCKYDIHRKMLLTLGQPIGQTSNLLPRVGECLLSLVWICPYFTAQAQSKTFLAKHFFDM